MNILVWVPWWFFLFLGWEKWKWIKVHFQESRAGIWVQELWLQAYAVSKTLLPAFTGSVAEART